jgi:plasmid stability protein
MSDWLLVIAALRDHVPTEATIREVLSEALSGRENKEAEVNAALKRVIVLDRHSLINMFGASFIERSRLFVEKLAPSEAAASKPSPSKCESTSRRESMSKIDL